MPPFKLDSVYTPTADQPKAIAGPGGGHRGGGALHDAARRDGHRQDDDDGRDDRGGAAAGADPRAQQDARGAAVQRVPDVLPEQLGRVLRLLLRLLPAGGVRPVAGPVHREGLGDQPGDRPAAPRGDGVAVRPPRRDHRRVGVGDLRPRLAADLQRQLPDPRQGRDAGPRRAAAQARLAAVHAATTRRSAAARSACAATRWRSSRPTRRRRSAPRSSATRSSGCSTSTR